MYAAHEYQTSNARAIIVSYFGYYDAFLFFLSHPLLLCPTFFKTRSLSLGAVFRERSLPSGSERSPAAKHIHIKRVLCALLCSMGVLKQFVFNNSKT